MNENTKQNKQKKKERWRPSEKEYACGRKALDKASERERRKKKRNRRKHAKRDMWMRFRIVKEKERKK